MKKGNKKVSNETDTIPAVRKRVNVRRFAVTYFIVMSGFFFLIGFKPLPDIIVKFGCNGLEAVMIYSVAVIVFPSALRTKMIGIIAGFLIIQLVNVARIAMLAYAGVHYKKLFDIFHIYVAQGLMIAIALGIYLLYLNYAGRQAEQTA
jgi:exosortase/archaeosortase family protein